MSVSFNLPVISSVVAAEKVDTESQASEADAKASDSYEKATAKPTVKAGSKETVKATVKPTAKPVKKATPKPTLKPV
jgi:hypothetical protein